MQRIRRLGEWYWLGEGSVVPYEITYLLDVVFSDYSDDPAPVTSPIVGRTGQLTVVENDGSFAITSGQLVFTAQSTPAWGDLEARDLVSRSRAAGLTLAYVNTEIIGSTAIGFDNNNSGVLGSNHDYFFAGQVQPRPATVNLIATSYWKDQLSSVILRNIGAFFFLGDTLYWVENSDNSNTVYAVISSFASSGAIDLFRLASLPANATYPVPALGIRDLDLCTPGAGTGTSSIASPAAGNTFVHTADTLIKWTVTTLPSAGAIQVFVRRSTSPTANNLEVYITNTGTLFLWQTVAGSRSALASSSGIVNGSILVAEFVGTSAKIWSDGVLKISTTVSVISGNLNGEIYLGTGGAIANLTARTLDGVANVASTNHPGYGLATSVLPGPRAAVDTFTHEADAIIEFQLDALPSAGNLDIAFRKQDATHEWIVRIDSTGALALIEDNAGETSRASAAGVLSGGERITVIAFGSTIKGYYDTTLAFTYASATNFQTATTGNVNALGTGGRISNLLAWPLDLASAPNTPEAANIKAAFDLMATP